VGKNSIYFLKIQTKFDYFG